jgi:hypothetical protein
MRNKMSSGAGSRFAGKKLWFVISLSAGLLLFAGTALAAAYAPATGTSGTMMMNQGAQPSMMMGAASGKLMMPCPMMMQQDTGTNMMYRTFPCGQPNYGNYPIMSYGHQAEWLGLMFIFTVMLVWVVLLLLIAVLWHHLKKHKHN